MSVLLLERIGATAVLTMNRPEQRNALDLELRAALSDAVAQQADAPAAAPPQTPAGVVATTNNPNLTVATVKLEEGSRLSRVIGMPVHNGTASGSPQVGKIDDLIMTEGNRVTMAVIAAGGFLGMGAKLVAVPWSQLQVQREAGRVVLPGATTEMLNGMPTFAYE